MMISYWISTTTPGWRIVVTETANGYTAKLEIEFNSRGLSTCWYADLPPEAEQVAIEEARRNNTQCIFDAPIVATSRDFF